MKKKTTQKLKKLVQRELVRKRAILGVIIDTLEAMINNDLLATPESRITALMALICANKALRLDKRPMHKRELDWFVADLEPLQNLLAAKWPASPDGKTETSVGTAARLFTCYLIWLEMKRAYTGTSGPTWKALDRHLDTLHTFILPDVPEIEEEATRIANIMVQKYGLDVRV